MPINKTSTARLGLILTLAAGAFLAGARLSDYGSAAARGGEVASLTPEGIVAQLAPEQSPVSAQAGSAKTADPLLVSTVVKRLKSRYVEPITTQRETAMARGVAKGLVAALDDPESRFLDPREVRDLHDSDAGTFHGIGAILAVRKAKVGKMDEARLVVVAAVPGGPAAKAGVKPGDSVTHINGKWIIAHNPGDEAGLRSLVEKVRKNEANQLELKKAIEAAEKKLREGMSIADAIKLLASDSSGDLTLEVERPRVSSPINLKMRARVTQVAPVRSAELGHGISYIRLTQFSKAAAAEFAQKVQSLRSQKARAVILDLRGNPGGSLSAATEIAGRLTGGGVIGVVQEKTRKRTITAAKTSGVKLPIAVLVDAGTASVAELVAAALREKASATIVGVKTFGDGLVQTPLLLKDGSAAIITTGKMLTPKGFGFDGKGLQPDKSIESSTAKDVQLIEAEKVLTARLRKA